MKTRLIFLFIILILNACMQGTTEFTYFDGNNNEYRISPELFQIHPIRENESSSGTYSGGPEPKSMALNESQYRLLTEVLENGMKASSDHAEKREMGTSLIIRKAKLDESTAYLRYGSESQRAIDAILNEMLSPTKPE